MPFEQRPLTPEGQSFLLWPHRSLPKRGFVWFIGITCAMFLIPLLGLLGTVYLLWMLPFLLAAVGAVWFALQKSYRDGHMLEELRLTPEQAELIRVDPKGQRHEWRANPYWTQAQLHQTGGPVPNYVTLKGGGREVEIGSFLSEDERKALFSDLSDALRSVSAFAPKGQPE